jgi:bifunctional UDP-N-acetylglucosamine pyrophosphorylase / glucosamine-1-phosphate N-acetyltransferase
MPDLHIVVLAAGKGTRMKSALPKVLHRVAGRPMIDYVLRIGGALQPASVTVVVGHAADAMQAAVADRRVRTVVQEPQLGTAHALGQTEGLLGDAGGTLLLLSGDVPLLEATTLQQLVSTHEDAKAAATVLTATVERPYGYGRIVRTQAGDIARIIEERDASPAERAIREINSGVYAFDLGPLWDALKSIAAQNAQGEYYLPDLIAIYRRRKLPVATVMVSDPRQIRGINSRTELAEVSAIVRQKKNEELMAAGVTLVDPATTYIEPDVVVGQDTVIHPNVHLEGTTVIGSACEIHAGSRIVDSTIGDRVTINNYTIVTTSVVTIV